MNDDESRSIFTIDELSRIDLSIAYVVREKQQELDKEGGGGTKPIVFVEAIRLASKKNSEVVEYYGKSLLQELDIISSTIKEEVKEKHYESIEKQYPRLWETIYEIIKSSRASRCWEGVAVAKTEPILHVMYCTNKEHRHHPLDNLNSLQPSSVPSFLRNNEYKKEVVDDNDNSNR